MRDGREERAVGLHEQAVERATRGGRADVGRVLERDDAAERHVHTRAQAALGLVGPAGEAVQDGALGHAFRTEDVEELVPRIARVDDERELMCVGQRDLRRERGALRVARRVFVVIVEAALAHTYGLALVIHARDAWDDLFDVLWAEGVPERTVLHCFTGGPDEADRCLRAGMYVSFSGIVTFKNASDVRAAAARCPLDRLLVETDSPFLAPVPHRGRANEPSYLPLVGETIAAVKECAVEEIKERTAFSTTMVFSTGG